MKRRFFMANKKTTKIITTKFGNIKVQDNETAPTQKPFAPNQDTIKKSIDDLNDASKKRVEQLKADAKLRGARMTPDQIVNARNATERNIAIKGLEKATRAQIDRVAASTRLQKSYEEREQEAWGFMSAIQPDTMLGSQTDPMSNEPRTPEERVSMSDIPELPGKADIDPATIGLKYAKSPHDSIPSILDPTFTIYDQKLEKSKTYTSIADAMADYQYAESKPGIPGNGGTGTENKDKHKATPISQIITNLIRDPKTRKYIIKVITGKELDDILKDSFGDTVGIFDEVGYEYMSGVVATATILKNYRMFKIWYEGFRFKR